MLTSATTVLLMDLPAAGISFLCRGTLHLDMAQGCRTFRMANCHPAGIDFRQESPLARRLVNEMPTLTQLNLREFVGRFHGFQDSLLRKLQIVYSQDGSRCVSAWIGARESCGEGDDWLCIRMDVRDVKSFCLSDNENTTNSVISNGIHICWFQNIIAVEFGRFVDPPETLRELMTSPLYATGSSVEWSVER